ncbi:MAG: sensor histidine kinase [Hyphomicrobiaceae bacterium]
MAAPSLFRSTVFRRTLAVVLLLTLVAAVVIGLVGWRANTIFTQTTSQAISADVALLKVNYRRGGLAALVTSIDERSRVGGGALYFLEGPDGQKLAGNLAEFPILSGAARAGTFRYRLAGPPKSKERLAAGVLIEMEGGAVLLAGRDINDQRTLLVAIYKSVGIGAILLAFLGVAGGIGLSRHILARIDKMAAASAGIMAGNFAGRLPVDGSQDELDRLALRLNAMLDRIEQLMTGLREVSDNIAHDLRTPLNRLRNRAEAALVDERGGAAWRNGLERVIDEADDLIRTFNALLLIARLEAGNAPEDQETFDLAEVARDLSELYEPLAEDEGFTLQLDLAASVPIRANRQLVGQAITNLIDNAFKYGAVEKVEAGPDTWSNGREVSIAVTREGEMGCVVVGDRGLGIAAEDRERALKRFVRLEKSRTKPGTGLGLSLVAAVARLHGGRIHLEDNAPGLKVVLEFPVAGGPDVAGTNNGHGLHHGPQAIEGETGNRVAAAGDATQATS